MTGHRLREIRRMTMPQVDDTGAVIRLRLALQDLLDAHDEALEAPSVPDLQVQVNRAIEAMDGMRPVGAKVTLTISGELDQLRSLLGGA